MRKHAVIPKEKLIGLDNQEQLKLAVNVLINKFKKDIPDIQSDELFCHFRYLVNGDLHIRGTYLGGTK